MLSTPLSPGRARLLAILLVLGLAAGLLVGTPDRAAAATCPCTVFSASQTPRVVTDSDTSAVELGMKFRADQAGSITGVRFYKGSANTGTHTGSLWSSAGTKLASVTFTNETASGWQQASFATPVAITAGTTYVVSYYAPNGRYSYDSNFFSSATVNAPLTALANGTDGANGVYRYGAAGGFPTSSYQSTNYWVDVVFTTSITADTTKPTVTDRSPATGATGVATGSSITATFSEGVQESTITWAVTGPGSTAVAGSKSYNATTRTATFTPSAALTAATAYSVTLSGAKDTAPTPNTMDPVTWTFTTGAAAGSCPCSIWASTGTPATPATADDSAVEVGVKFRSTQAGYITGIRFYKGSGNTGTHVGSLWNAAAGTKLASVTFTNESSTGWQQAQFAGPVAITAGTTYVASYYAPVGRYSTTNGHFAAATTNGPLTALRDGTDGGNGVYLYGATGFPNNTYQSTNYWVDVVFSTTANDTTAPSVSVQSPAGGSNGVAVNAAVTATFSEPVQTSTVTMTLTGPSGAVTGTKSPTTSPTQSVTFTPSAALAYSGTYTVNVSGAKDVAGNTMAATSWSFTTGAKPASNPDEGPGGPIAVVTSSANPYSKYLAEILRTEGLNEFATIDVGTLSASTLASYDLVVLGNVTLSAAQVTALTTWVNGGGNLIAMRPKSNLSSLMGLTAASGTTTDGYLLVDNATAPGAGIVNRTIQFHGVADSYTLQTGTSRIATLYSNATTVTAGSRPAVTLRSVGTKGGEAAAFTFDLPQSIQQTRQGNPAWAGRERDNDDAGRLIRSNDMFFGIAPDPDWVNLSQVEIPQADEQQRLLANLIQTMNRDKKPIPRFWYFPRGLKAVVIGTGDDHANGGTAGRFEQLIANSPNGCSVSDWTCLRYSSYVYPNSPLTNANAATYNNLGFEVGVHETTGCANFDASSLAAAYTRDLSAWKAKYQSLPSPVSNRTHCLVFTDWASQPKTELANGMRLDGNYYYWPGFWIKDRPGFMTGSGMPMRFGDTNGAMIDVYQAPTQVTDESDQSYPGTVDALLDKALGAEGYYAAVNVNFHTDTATRPHNDALIASALARGVPIVSGKQMTTWLDGRNSSSYSGIGWNASTGTLSFTVNVGTGATGLTGMVPIAGPGGTQLSGLTRGGSSVSYQTVTVKGLAYAQFPAAQGTYAAKYGSAAASMAITAAAAEVQATPDQSVATLSWSTPDTASSEVALGTDPSALSTKVVTQDVVEQHEVQVEELKPATKYYYRLTSKDLKGRVTTWPAAGSAPASFTTPGKDTAKPVVTAASASAMPDGTVVVKWSTNEPSSAVVRLGKRADRLVKVGQVDELAKTHELMLTDLDPDTTYYIAGDSTDASGNTGSSKVRSFTTPAAGVTDQQTASFRMGTAAGDAVIDDSGLGAVTLSGSTSSARRGTFTSRVMDAQAMADWERTSIRQDLPAGTTIVLRVRTGSMSTPDKSWTAWKRVPKSGLVSRSSRYIQYEVTLVAPAGAKAPSVAGVGISNNAGPIEHPNETDRG